MTKTRKLSYGHYELTQDGVAVAVVSKVRDSGEPLWALTPLGDFPVVKTASGRVFSLDSFVALKDAQRFYDYHSRQTPKE
jgi:hypothetical protein